MKEKNIESSLIDFAATAQPTLLLMSDDGITKQWRLNYNVAETQVPFLSNEQQENQMLTTQYRCNYIPAEGGLLGNPPRFEDYVILLKNEGCTELEIESIKSEYQSFIESNF